MTAFVLDTYQLVTRLKAGGYSEQQAETFVNVLNELDGSHLATKQDMLSLRQEVKEAISDLKLDFKVELAALRNELTRWMFGGFMTLFLAILSLMFKSHL